MGNVVYTKERLEEEKENKPQSITIKGDLANNLHKIKKMGQLSKASSAAIVAILGGAVISAPVSEGISYGSAIPVAVVSGLEIAMIIWASTIGIGFLLDLFDHYTEEQYSNNNLVLIKK